MPSTRRSMPTFSLTRSEKVVVRRPAEVEYEYGRPIQREPTEHLIEANIQPLKFTELMSLSESDRTKDWIKGFCDLCQDIRGAKEGDDGWEADIVVWQNKEYKVFKVQEYRMGVLDHIQFHAVRTPISAGGGA